MKNVGIIWHQSPLKWAKIYFFLLSIEDDMVDRLKEWNHRWQSSFGIYHIFLNKCNLLVIPPLLTFPTVSFNYFEKA